MILRAAVWALSLTCFLDRQIDLRMGIPQVHARHRAGQWQIIAAYLVSMLCVSGNQVFFDGAVSRAHYFSQLLGFGDWRGPDYMRSKLPRLRGRFAETGIPDFADIFSLLPELRLGHLCGQLVQQQMVCSMPVCAVTIL